jgi:hypothetical protein
MSKFHDDSTRADAPGGLALSERKLRALEPELFSDRTFECSPGCRHTHPASEMRERIAEHLELGDSRAAIVVSISPLIVAAYSDDLDAVALLRFPATFAVEQGLTVGSRLLTVNTYRNDVAHGVPRYDPDLVPGPARVRWTGFHPLIAEFLSDDTRRIDARKHEIREGEWQTTERLARIRIERFGLETARSGKPTRAGFPGRAVPSSPPSRGTTLPLGGQTVVVIVAILIALLVLLAQSR